MSLDFEYDDYEYLWQLGVEDGSTNEFNQELGGSFPPPGSPTTRDDDYYFAGFYSTVGIVSADETITDPVDQSNASADPVGMERSVTSGAPESRIHFMLNGGQAAPSNEYRFEMTLLGGGWWNAATSANGGYGIHDVEITFNGVSIFNEIGIIANTDVRKHFTAESVNAVTGENVIEIVRTGGDSDPANPGVSNGWIQFDYFSLESRASTASPLGFQISSFTHNSSAGSTSVTFPSSPGQTFRIETSLNLDDWNEIESSLPAHSTEPETTYSLNQPGAKSFIRVIRN